MVPPIVGALRKLHGGPSQNEFPGRRIASCPGAQVNSSHQHDGYHPLKQLLIGQFQFMC